MRVRGGTTFTFPGTRVIFPLATRIYTIVADTLDVSVPTSLCDFDADLKTSSRCLDYGSSRRHVRQYTPCYAPVQGNSTDPPQGLLFARRC